jgi:hypothetical protein
MREYNNMVKDHMREHSKKAKMRPSSSKTALGGEKNKLRFNN